MSLFSRVLSRAGAPGHRPAALARPKGLNRAPAPPPEDGPEEDAAGLARLDRSTAPGPDAAEDPRLDPARALRRTPGDIGQDEREDASQDALPLRRTPARPAPEPEQDGTLPRAPDHAPARDADEEDLSEPTPLAPVRRALAGKEEEETTAPPLSPARRLPVLAPRPAPGLTRAPADEGLDPETSPRPDALSAEPDDTPAMALRRFQAGPPAGAPAGAGSVPAGWAGDADATSAPPPMPPVSEPFAGPAMQWDPPPTFPPAHAPEARAPAPERPRVVIEQVDVVIHDSAPAGPAADGLATLGRALRARYIGGA